MSLPVPIVEVVRHPLLSCQLARLRAEASGPAVFRRAMHEAAHLLAIRATDGLAVREVTVRTPLGPALGHELASRCVLVPVLRAGLAFLDAFLDVLPDAHVGYLGLARDEATLEAREYYQKLPEGLGEMSVFVLDPMLATGGSAVAALRRLDALGARDMTLVSLVSAPEGVRAVNAAYPAVRVLTAALDERLDARGFIVPGLGDAGDRWNGGV
jgi:uracil phosphoribosyltransferase